MEVGQAARARVVEPRHPSFHGGWISQRLRRMGCGAPKADGRPLGDPERMANNRRRSVRAARRWILRGAASPNDLIERPVSGTARGESELNGVLTGGRPGSVFVEERLREAVAGSRANRDWLVNVGGARKGARPRVATGRNRTRLTQRRG